MNGGGNNAAYHSYSSQPEYSWMWDRKLFFWLIHHIMLNSTFLGPPNTTLSLPTTFNCCSHFFLLRVNLSPTVSKSCTSLTFHWQSHGSPQYLLLSCFSDVLYSLCHYDVGIFRFLLLSDHHDLLLSARHMMSCQQQKDCRIQCLWQKIFPAECKGEISKVCIDHCSAHIREQICTLHCDISPFLFAVWGD